MEPATYQPFAFSPGEITTCMVKWRF